MKSALTNSRMMDACSKMRIDLSGPIGARDKLPIIPGRDEPLPCERTQVRMQLLQQRLILVRVGDEDGDGGSGRRHYETFDSCMNGSLCSISHLLPTIPQLG